MISIRELRAKYPRGGTIHVPPDMYMELRNLNGFVHVSELRRQCEPDVIGWCENFTFVLSKEGMQLAGFCRSCGAPAEPHKCSYCGNTDSL